eukprot:CAMPEP_0185598060 /NCGR_PEP_ID=MMETSP0434-20130131/81765_1 /TAXON_ID=626734 ORGANISM="Favella taraikaensis, Strain Fe Narragansett Bay" /NCGR_SAMPLE_ID=MMETSP0434 /ASSEMBLY_ACC=CAM_ASM_000379 /LENGTH=113 /DNA_ID=CAMNT_0028226955 /DNA_START=996 /DNA_END=1337 /DNA_ORIENTATION=-
MADDAEVPNPNCRSKNGPTAGAALLQDYDEEGSLSYIHDVSGSVRFSTNEQGVVGSDVTGSSSEASAYMDLADELPTVQGEIYKEMSCANLVMQQYTGGDLHGANNYYLSSEL